MKYYEIIETKEYNTIAKLRNIIKIVVRHNSDGNYTDIIFTTYDEYDNVTKKYRITLNQNISIIIEENEE